MDQRSVSFVNDLRQVKERCSFRENGGSSLFCPKEKLSWLMLVLKQLRILFRRHYFAEHLDQATLEDWLGADTLNKCETVIRVFLECT